MLSTRQNLTGAKIECKLRKVVIAFFHIDVIQRHGAISHAPLAREKRINSPCIPGILNTLASNHQAGGSYGLDSTYSRSSLALL